MTIKELLTELKHREIDLFIKDGELAIDAPKGTVTTELKEKIGAFKNDILNILHEGKKNPSPIKKTSHQGHIPLSEKQRGLWFINKFQEGAEAQYNIPWSYKILGKLDCQALEKAFNTVIQRHESLRTKFREIDGDVVQVIEDELKLVVEPTQIIESEIDTNIDQHANHVFDLTQGALIKVDLLRLSDNEHILLINIHHIISDGWSLSILNKELNTLYDDYTKGLASSLTPLPIQYADFVDWERQQMRESSIAEGIDFWNEKLSGAPALLELPTRYARPSKQSFNGASENFVIPQSLTKQLNILAKGEHTTLFSVLMATFQVLLHRLSGETDICVGVPFANRHLPELEKLIGLFLNVAVFRNQIDTQSSYKDFLQYIHETNIAVQDYQNVPFERLVEILQPERSLSYTPIFQVMLVLQSASDVGLNLHGLTTLPSQSSTCTSKFDLTMELVESSEGILGRLEYSTDLFDQNTIERFCQHYQILLEGIVENPNQSIGTLPLLSEPEKQQLLVDWNQTEAPYPRDRCIHTLFERQVADTPDAIAVVFEDQQLTFSELNEKSNQLAHYLVEQGVGPEVRVGICLERSFEMIIGILGILKAGGAYVPLDPDYPINRINYILQDCDPLLVLTQSKLSDELSKLLHRNNAILLDQEWEQIRSAEKQSTVRKREAQAHNLAYVIYTSGSTGKPKGVMVNHQNVVNTLHFLEQTYPVQKNDAYLLKTNYVFDVSLSELFGWFMGPGRLAILPPEEEKSPESIIEHIEKHAITHLNFAPSMLSVFVEEARQNRAFISRCPLKYLMVAGEAFPKPLVKACVELFSTTSVENIYGPTESSIYSAWHSCRQGEVDSEHTPIGRPINNTQLYVVDSHLQPVPIGVAGELCIAGAGLARGYLNRPELTEKTFIDNPFNPGSKLYKTGDVVRYLTDGNIEYIGRVDHQVKIRGFRIELGEIENTLVAQESVREAIVLAYSRDGSGGNHYLVAYLVHEQGLDIDQNQLRENLKISLPDYMVPSFFIQLDELPLTPNGKVDRKALPIPDADSIQTQEYVPPSTDIEKALVGIWAEILNLPTNKIGIMDNFFELGGHSLLALRLIARAKTFFRKDLQLSVLFNATTISSLAHEIHNAPEKKIWSPLVPIQTDGSFLPLFCIHPGGGGVFCYADIAKHLKHRGLPIYGLQARGLIRGQQPYSTIGEAAEDYIKAIKEIQPSGPYNLLGWSSGGTIAHEIAYRISKSEEKVAFVGLLDSRIFENFIDQNVQRAEILAMVIQKLTSKSLDHAMPDMITQTNGLNTREIISYVFEFLKKNTAPKEDFMELERLINVLNRNIQFMSGYKLPFYKGKLTLFQASEASKSITSFDSALLGNFNWKAHATEFEKHAVAGSHANMLYAPNAQQLSESIWNCLRKTLSPQRK